MKKLMTASVIAAAGLLTGIAAAQDPGKPGKQPEPIVPKELPKEPGGLKSTVFDFDRDSAGRLPAGWTAAARGGAAAPAATPRDPGGDAPKTPSKADEPKSPAKGDEPGGAGGGVWAVTADPTAPSAPHALRVTGSTLGINGYNLCTHTGGSHMNVALAAKLRADTGNTSQGGGLAWRVRDPDNFYGCALNPADGKLHVYRVAAGKAQEIGSGAFTGSGPGASTWYTVQARMTGDSIVCSIDGKELVRVNDGSIKDGGSVGLWTRGDAGTSFDEVRVMAAPGGKDLESPGKKPGDPDRKPSEPPKDDK